MYYSEYLRNKKLAAAKIISPSRDRSSGLQTQILRYKSSQVQGVQSDGQSLVRSSEGVLGAKGHAAVCCVDTIKQPTVVQGCCSVPTGSARWVAVGLDTNGDSISYSLDGNTWITTGGGGFYNIGGTGIVYGNRWVATGFLDLAGIQYSDDGTTWQPGSGSIVDNNFAGFSVAYNGDIWVAVGLSFNNNNNITWSPDGINWNDSSGEFIVNGDPGLGLGVAYGNNTWVAVGTDTYGHNIKYSPDGKVWTDASGSFVGGGGSYLALGYGVGYGNDENGQPLWVAVGVDYNGNNIKYSPDGQNWSDASSSFPNAFGTDGAGFGVAYGDNKWVAVGIDGTNNGNNILYSSDGRTWNIANGSFGIGTGGVSGGPGTGYSVSYFVETSEWIAVGENESGQNLLRSPNGIDWTADTSPLNSAVRGIAYNPNAGNAVKPAKTPRGFYGPPRPDCPPVNGGPVIPKCCAPQPRNNLITNGSFEFGDKTNWMDEIDCNLNIILYSEGADDGPYQSSHPGNPTYVAKGGCVGERDRLSQIFLTTPGSSYTLTYWLYDDGGPGPIYFSASIDGTVIPGSVIDYPDGETDPGFAWTQYSFTFTASSTSTELTFEIQQAPDYFYLTSISVV